MRTSQAETQARKSVLGAVFWGRGRQRGEKRRKEKSLPFLERWWKESYSTRKPGMERLRRDILMNRDVFYSDCLPAWVLSKVVQNWLLGKCQPWFPGLCQALSVRISDFLLLNCLLRVLAPSALWIRLWTELITCQHCCEWTKSN